MSILFVSAFLVAVALLSGAVLGNLAFAVLCKFWNKVKDLEIE